MIFSSRSFLAAMLILACFPSHHHHVSATVDEPTLAAKPDYGKLIMDSFNTADSDVEEFQKIWELDGYYKTCFAGAPACMEGNYEQVFRPFLNAIKTFKLDGTYMTGSDPSGSGYLAATAFFETKLGCKAIYSSISYNEIDPNSGKVTKHISYSDDSQELMKCVTEYFASLEEKSDL